jgi:hypothetical protein
MSHLEKGRWEMEIVQGHFQFQFTSRINEVNHSGANIFQYVNGKSSINLSLVSGGLPCGCATA